MDFQAYAVRELTAVADTLADTAKKQLEAATAQLTANFDATIARLRNDQSELANDNERLTTENAALSWEKGQLIEAAKTASRGPLIERLEEVFETIGSSKTVDAVLLAAARGLVGDFNRVAVFAGDKKLIQLGADQPAIDPTAAAVLTFPIMVRGEKLGLLAAADETRPGEGIRLASVVRSHVLLALERLTVEMKAVSELRAYAQMLLDEVEYVFNADTTAHLKASERRERLTENLRCARQIYGQRVTLDGPAAASVLDDVLAQLLDARAETAFGQELADAVTAPSATAS